MKLLVNREALAEAMRHLSAVVPDRTPKPVLTCVRMVAKDKRLFLQATDMEASLSWWIDQVDIAAPGEALAPARKLMEILSGVADDTLTLEAVNDTMLVRGSASLHRLLSYDAGGFPPVSEPEGEPAFTVSAGALERAIRLTRGCIGKEPTRYCLNGLLLEIAKNRLTAVSTDGHQLALVREDVAGDRKASGVIPGRAVDLVAGLLTDPEAPVECWMAPVVGQGRAFLRIGGAILFSTALLQGTFPPYDDVIPKGSDKKALIDRKRLLAALRGSAVMTSTESKGLRLEFSNAGGQGKLVISARTPELGEATVDMPVDYTGEPLAIGFNHDYLIDFAKVVEEDFLTAEFLSPNRPGLFKAGAGFLHVLSPVNLS